MGKFAGLTAPAVVTLLTADASEVWAQSLPGVGPDTGRRSRPMPPMAGATQAAEEPIVAAAPRAAVTRPSPARSRSPLRSTRPSPIRIASAIGRLDDLVALAGQHHLVTAALWPAVRGDASEARLDPDLAAYLEAVHALNLQRNLRMRSQAAELAEALNGVGVEPVFLKGVALLLLGLAPDPGRRLIGDIDVLVPADRFDAAAEALRAVRLSRPARASARGA